MFICMRTTLNLDDEILKAVKHKAAESGMTMTQVIEDALRDALQRPDPVETPFRLQLPTVKGERLPTVDITDRDVLYEVMESRR